MARRTCHPRRLRKLEAPCGAYLGLGLLLGLVILAAQFGLHTVFAGAYADTAARLAGPLAGRRIVRCHAGGREAPGDILTLEAPPARPPALPVESSAVLREFAGGAEAFTGMPAELAHCQEVTRRLQDVSVVGRRLMFVAMAKLQRADTPAAHAALEAAAALPTPAAALGPELWADEEGRLRLCDAAGHASYVQAAVACRGLLSFLETGVLTPKMPDDLRIGIDDVDDERYLIGLLDATRELERFAVNRGQALDLRSIEICLGAVQSLEQAMLQFDFRNGDVRRRYDGLKYVVQKLETLAFEVGLARKRAALAAGEDELVDAEPALAAPAAVAAVDLQLLQDIKERYESFDGMREQTLKLSRDVAKGAKNAVYALQRESYAKADELLLQCAKDANGIFEAVVAKSPSLRNTLFGASLEELAEALAYRAFRRERKLLNREEMQAASGLSFPLTLPEYLGGLMDLTGEVGRLAVRSAGRGRAALGIVELCLACVEAVYEGMQELPSLPGGLGKKLWPLKGTLTKIEGILYEIALLSQGGLKVRAPMPSFSEGEEEAGSDEADVG